MSRRLSIERGSESHRAARWRPKGVVARAPRSVGETASGPGRSGCACGGGCPRCRAGERFDGGTEAAAWTEAKRGSAGALPYRRELERSFGADLSGVRAWTGRGAQLGRLGAVAAARGEDVAFAAAAPSPAVVAHEVAHVLQYRRLPAGALERLPWRAAGASGPEREAHVSADRAARGLGAPISQAAGAGLHRLEPGEEPKRVGLRPEDFPVKAVDPANVKQAERVRATLRDMSRSSDFVTRNTAHRVLDGNIIVDLIEDQPLHPDQGAVLAIGGRSASEIKRMLREGAVYDLLPGGDSPKYILHDAKNFYAQEIDFHVFIRGKASREEIRVGLEHETNHALNPDWSTPQELFDTEARAYYVVEHRDADGSRDDMGRDLRVELAKQSALTHLGFEELYHHDAAFRAHVDAWTPTGNLLNSP